jgi:predicted negative regulator of RcsB-dependent stress response
LRDGGKVDEAIAVLEMNGEFYPKSADIDFLIGELLFARGDRDKALVRYRATLEKAPAHAAAKRRISEIEKK